MLLIVLLVLPMALSSCALFGQCAGAYIADTELDVPGYPTPQDAVEGWIEERGSYVSPDGWSFEEVDPDVVHAKRDGGWNLEIMRTTQEGWVVTALSCGN